MKSRLVFSKEEVLLIRKLLIKKDNTSSSQQKAIREKLRGLGFFISDFKTPNRSFSADDFSLLLDKGDIKISKDYQNILNVFIRTWIFIKNNPYKFFMFLISFVTLLIVYKGYKSPADSRCEMSLVQRPDSIFQVQICIWNEGDEQAENIILMANKEKVFLADTSKKMNKLNLRIYPFLSVVSELTPTNVLSRTGKVIQFKKHRIVIEKLPHCEKDDNVFIITPSYSNLKKLKNNKHSIFESLYMKLNDIPNLTNYIEEVLNNIQISADGRILNIKFGRIVPINEQEKEKYFFPSNKDYSKYKSMAIAPYYKIPPLQIIKRIKFKQENNSGYSKYKGYRGYLGY